MQREDQADEVASDFKKLLREIRLKRIHKTIHVIQSQIQVGES